MLYRCLKQHTHPLALWVSERLLTWLIQIRQSSRKNLYQKNGGRNCRKRNWGMPLIDLGCHKITLSRNRLKTSGKYTASQMKNTERRRANSRCSLKDKHFSPLTVHNVVTCKLGVINKMSHSQSVCWTTFWWSIILWAFGRVGSQNKSDSQICDVNESQWTQVSAFVPLLFSSSFYHPVLVFYNLCTISNVTWYTQYFCHMSDIV